ncbi:unnamed protein product [Bemisia tabaci]|uniref:Transposable element P transposase-like RNase H C-terminal domain-containing protein n=1 Tax=Bemisia tabaci TaxID=7038 RepID=A0A9P0A3A5_BEMTA|nr:unnamed protein product [Bemisia tabaci]
MEVKRTLEEELLCFVKAQKTKSYIHCTIKDDIDQLRFQDERLKCMTADTVVAERGLSLRNRIEGTDLLADKIARRLEQTVLEGVGVTMVKPMRESFEIANEARTSVENEVMNTLKTYLFCRDHIEMFFDITRQHSGYNRNPTCRQFQSAYKKCLVQLELKAVETGRVCSEESAWYRILQCPNLTMSVEVQVPRLIQYYRRRSNESGRNRSRQGDTDSFESYIASFTTDSSDKESKRITSPSQSLKRKIEEVLANDIDNSSVGDDKRKKMNEMK